MSRTLSSSGPPEIKLRKALVRARTDPQSIRNRYVVLSLTQGRIRSTQRLSQLVSPSGPKRGKIGARDGASGPRRHNPSNVHRALQKSAHPIMGLCHAEGNLHAGLSEQAEQSWANSAERVLGRSGVATKI